MVAQTQKMWSGPRSGATAQTGAPRRTKRPERISQTLAPEVVGAKLHDKNEFEIDDRLVPAAASANIQQLPDNAAGCLVPRSHIQIMRPFGMHLQDPPPGVLECPGEGTAWGVYLEAPANWVEPPLLLFFISYINMHYKNRSHRCCGNVEDKLNR